MEEEGLRAIPVVSEDGEFRGVVSYRDLIRHVQFNPQRTGIDKVMHQPPELDAEMNLVEVSDLRINSGRKLMVMVEGDSLKGTVGETEILKVLPNVDELENVSSRDLSTGDVESVRESDSLEKARHLMLDKNISRLPVTDEDGHLTGIVRSPDMLRMMVGGESQDPGGTSGRRTGSEMNVSGGSEKQEMSEIPVKELMERTVSSREKHLNAVEAAEQMLDSETTEIIFTDQRNPEAILTVKDFIDYLTGFAPGNTVLVNLIGLDVQQEKAAVHDQIKNQLRGSLGRKLERPEELTVRFKKAEKDGKRHRWEIEMKLYSEYGMINVEEESWEMLEAVDEALKELDSIIREKKERRTEH